MLDAGLAHDGDDGKVLAYFAAEHPQHEDAEVVHEHDRVWVTCPTCGAQWGAHDVVSLDGQWSFSFEQVSEGDGYCDEHAVGD